MRHLTVKATTTATDQELGTFEAIVSGWDEDRERDVIVRTAFDRTIEAWQRWGKNLPLLFEHSSEAIGHINPFSMHATDDGLVVAGEVDRSTEKGQMVWKQIKRGTAGFSIGYASEDRPRRGGGRELIEIDLLEISATSRPMGLELEERGLRRRSSARLRRDVPHHRGARAERSGEGSDHRPQVHRAGQGRELRVLVPEARLVWASARQRVEHAPHPGSLDVGFLERPAVQPCGGLVLLRKVRARLDHLVADRIQVVSGQHPEGHFTGQCLHSESPSLRESPALRRQANGGPPGFRPGRGSSDQDVPTSPAIRLPDMRPPVKSRRGGSTTPSDQLSDRRVAQLEEDEARNDPNDPHRQQRQRRTRPRDGR